MMRTRSFDNSPHVVVEDEYQHCHRGIQLQKGQTLETLSATQGIFVEENGSFFAVNTGDWDELISAPGLLTRVRESCNGAAVASLDVSDLLPPVGSQEVWAAGVT